MNYFDYNCDRAGNKVAPEIAVLEFSGNEVIEVDEDHSVTVDDVRDYIRRLRRDAEQKAIPSNVVSIHAA